MVKSRYVVMIDGQNSVTNMKLRTTLSRAVGYDLSNERNAFSHRGDDDEAETFIFTTHHRHVVRINHATSIANSARISSIWKRKVGQNIKFVISLNGFFFVVFYTLWGN